MSPAKASGTTRAVAIPVMMPSQTSASTPRTVQNSSFVMTVNGTAASAGAADSLLLTERRDGGGSKGCDGQHGGCEGAHGSPFPGWFEACSVTP